MAMVSNAEVIHTAELFERRGVDYRVIGSMAVRLYNIIGESESKSDIDIIIPRDDIGVTPIVRKELKKEFGRRVILGTLPSITTINFSPSGISRLEHRDISVPLDRLTMDEVSIDSIKTLKPETLAGLYETIGGFMKLENIKYKNAFIDMSDEETDPAFDEFKKYRRDIYPLYAPSKMTADRLSRIVPKSARLAIQDFLESRIEKYAA
jgi:predicted nucleotidyltransferase